MNNSQTTSVGESSNPEPQRKNGPLSPALSPSPAFVRLWRGKEGEREIRRPHLHPAFQLKGWAIFVCPFGTRLWRNLRTLAFAILSLLVVPYGRAATISENFSTNPLQNGWQVFGNTNLFGWDATNHQLA